MEDNMSVLIREATEQDIPLIDADLYPYLHDGHVPSESYIRMVINAPDYILVVVDSGTYGKRKLVGAATLHVIIQGSRGLKGYIDDLVILPAERRKGYGKMLFFFLEQAARQQGCSHVFFTSAPWRESANEFHRALGYTLRAEAVKDGGTNYYEKKLG
jgi:N-acetylglutamate synthase-like GNAT family acetyltransferase